mgnify:CR=1 FL=1
MAKKKGAAKKAADKVNREDFLAEFQKFLRSYRTWYYEPEALPNHQVFDRWHMAAKFGLRPEEVTLSLTGKSNDCAADAVYWDDEIKVISVLQYKYHVAKATESWEKVEAVVNIAAKIHEMWLYDEAGELEGCNEALKTKLEGIRHRKGYAIEVTYASTGSFSSQTRQKAAGQARRLSKSWPVHAVLEDYNAVYERYQYFLRGVAPLLPEYIIRLSRSSQQIIDTIDRKNGLRTIIGVIPGTELKKIYERFGDLVFSLNVRGFRGSTDINETIADTAENTPGRFLYFNNGVTMLASKCTPESPPQGKVLRISNMQIVNGQQTTRVLSEIADSNSERKVLLKVYSFLNHEDVVEKWDPAFGAYSQLDDELVGGIVAGTNRQNAISKADLQSNDPLQVELERRFQLLGVLYQRKAMRRAEFRKRHPGKQYEIVKKEKIAQVVAATTMDPADARSPGKLFGPEHYGDIFHTRKVGYYLYRYFVFKNISKAAGKVTVMRRGVWVGLAVAWREGLEKIFVNEPLTKYKAGQLLNINSLVNQQIRQFSLWALAQVKEYYDEYAKKAGDLADDPDSHFKKTRGLHETISFRVRNNKKAKKQRDEMLKEIRTAVRDLRK